MLYFENFKAAECRTFCIDGELTIQSGALNLQYVSAGTVAERRREFSAVAYGTWYKIVS